ncbi:carbon-nitrogen hydrolase family protein [Calditrichota bacterium]
MFQLICLFFGIFLIPFTQTTMAQTMNSQTTKVAAAQATPIFLNKKATLEKACRIINEAGKNGAKLVVFPEAFIAGYPDWVWVIPNSKGAILDELYIELVRNAVTIPDKSTELLCQAAKDANIYVVMGMSERNTEASNSSLYNTLLYIDDKGNILGKHRKLIPTGGERLVWAQGDGSTLQVFETPFAKLGGLICWENYMPLARQAMYAAGTQILAAPTWDKSENWLLSMKHIAREGGMFVISSCMVIGMKDIPDRYEFRNAYPEGREWINSGNSCIVNPKGEVIAGPVEKKEEIIYAEIDLNLVTSAKRMFDAAGHYARPDVFQFKVNRETGTK